MNNLKKVYKLIMLIIVVSAITFILTSVYLYNKMTNTSVYANSKILDSEFIKKIYTLKQIINREYLLDVNEEDLLEGSIKGYIDGLGDKYTEYFTKEEMEEFLTETEGNYVGIGIYIAENIEDNTVVILAPIKDSPAEKAGLLPGDVIKKIDGIEYTGESFEKVATYIKGKEGTKVKLTIVRNDKEIEFEVERKRIDLYPVESEMLENNIGYINITSFDDGCAKEFKEVYNKLNKNKIKGLIIDVRNNGGGILGETLEIVDYILEKDNTVLITKDKEENEEIEKTKKKPIITVPIVVLTNENTASASEILAAALKENNRATIVGETTYGKGLIQELIPLNDGSGIKITIEEYYTPNRNKINEVGVVPDVEVYLPDTVENEYNVELKDDTQLQEAIKILKNK